MHGFSFGTLALLTVLGFAGPLLASLPRLGIPVTIGELIAGLVVGKTGFGLIDDTNPTLQLLANIGFALVMFVVGTHVPVRDPDLRSAVPRALARAVLVGAVAAPLGIGLAAEFGTGHGALYAVLVGGGDFANDRFAALARTASVVRDGADRDCKRRMYCVAAVGD
jgi:Kef-type K+ transport system membrane component KefB